MRELVEDIMQVGGLLLVLFLAVCLVSAHDDVTQGDHDEVEDLDLLEDLLQVQDIFQDLLEDNNPGRHDDGQLDMAEVVRDVNKFLITGRRTALFRRTLGLLKLQTPIRGRTPVLDMKLLEGRAGNAPRKHVSCGVCTLAMTVALSWFRSLTLSRDQVITRSIRLCTAFNIQKEPVCRGFVEAHVDLALYLQRNRAQRKIPITASEACGLAVYPDCPMRGPAKAFYDWKLDLDFLGPKPAAIEETPPPTEEDTMQVLHITDVHVDPDYLPGSNAMCVEPTCCRNDSSGVIKEGGTAGYWGDYRDCDSPFHAFSNLVQQAAKTHPNVSHVMFTGDAVDHAMWATNQDRNSDIYRRVIDEIRKYFPTVPLLPAIGNHETHPVNVFVTDLEGRQERSEDFENLSTDWVYKLAEETWSEWLPKSVRMSVYEGGSYAYEVKPGLLVVSLNNNFCYTFNWWLAVDNEDPAGQLMWLAETLAAAEQKGQKVHLMAHVPGNTYNCLAAWRREYQRIVNRFDRTVVAQFHGHEHTDYFALYYDHDAKERPNNVAFVAGSATPFTNVNPTYRVYTVEATQNFRVLDHENWSYNLTEANLAGPEVEPNWQKLYSFNEAYGTNFTLVDDLHDFVLRLAVDPEMQNLYFRHTVRNADTALAFGCDAKCLRHLVCDIIDADPVKSKSDCKLPKPQKSPIPPNLN